MIPVVPVDEPAYFDERVRKRGNRFLATVPLTSSVNYAGHDYWRECKDDLKLAFKQLCAYTALYVEEVTGAESVEHFVPKQKSRRLAYEWRNYRFVCSRMNSRKGVDKKIIDPFKLPAGLFEMLFPSMLMTWSPNATAYWRRLARETIDGLDLNDERCVRARLRYASNFANGHISETYLVESAPLIASELRRQGLSQAGLATMLAA